MTIDTLITLLIAVVGSAVTVGSGYLVFRNDQKNKNLAIDTRFNNVDKDIVKNDERIRRDVNEHKANVVKEFDKLENQMEHVKENMNDIIKSDAESKIARIHQEKIMNDVNKKIDIILKALTSNRGVNDEKS